MSRAKVEIDLKVLEENYRAIRGKVPPDVKMLCVVKADGYGHGAGPVARTLESAGANYFGVATIDEGVELRNNGISLPILVMGGLMPWDEIEAVRQYQLTPVVADVKSLKRIAQDAGQDKLPISVHVKIDTGMGRLGFSLDEVDALASALKGARYVQVEGVMSHFACSEQRDEYGMNQIGRFEEAVGFLKRHAVQPPLVHMANSGAVCQYPEAYFSMVRLGIMLYGSYSDPRLADKIQVRPVMKLASRVAYVKFFPAQAALSYGRTFITSRKTKVAYIAAGYADGVPRALSNKGAVLLRGRRCPIIGRVCMDWLLVDATDLPQVEPGDEAVLMGGDGNDAITADEIAGHAGTIPYEILCSVSRRMSREYV
ncbi:MAG TPA: alanine racemase [Syntrophorhabdales bacterium]|nr:alanine racemase [Syntrophorhabdales bacterium]